MTETSEQREQWRAWGEAAADPAVDRELRAIYDAISQEIERRSPTCWLSGNCCNFDSYGHRLYVTGLEVAWMMQRLDAPGKARLQDAQLPRADGCPFQVEKLCSVRELRPLGCRLFYCDPSAEPWMNDVYEQFLSQLRGLHERHDVPYAYMEWRQALADARSIIKA